MIRDLNQDLRFAVRILLRNPGFTLIAACTLALGIGANSAVFSVVRGVLLRPLPFEDPHQLVAIWDRGIHEKDLSKLFDSYRDFEEWRRTARSFESVAAATWATGGRILSGSGPARQVLAIPASAEFFSTLGVNAALGRTFMPSDESNGCSVVLGNTFWRNALGADGSVVGKSLSLDQSQCTVLGVMPPEFAFYPTAADMWMLLNPSFRPKRDQMVVGVFARLKPGVSIEQAQAEVASIHETIHAADGRERNFTSVVYPLQGEFTWLTNRNLPATLAVLSAAVAFVLLIASVNVAHLLLGRSAVREREMAVRAALGCGRARLIRQLFTEGLLLALLGGALGTFTAFGAVKYFQAVKPIELPVGARVSIDALVLLFTALATLVTAILFALLPAIRASRTDVNESLKAGSRTALRGPAQWVARALITAEVALSLTLLSGAGLLMRSLLSMESAPLGFDPEHLQIASIALPAATYSDGAKKLHFYERLLERLQSSPGVEKAAVTSKLAPYGGGNQILEIEGRVVAPGSELHDTGVQSVSSAYFNTMRLPLRRGRAFDDRDQPNSAAVAIVNEALVRQHFPRTDPIGQRVRIADDKNHNSWMTVVGVCADERHSTLLDEMRWSESPTIYRPLAQEASASMSLVVRSPRNVGLRAAIAYIDPKAPLPAAETMRQRLSKILAYPQFRAVLMSAFAICAVLLAAVGLYGVLAQFVAHRTREFGVRMAIGARVRDIVLMVAWQGGVPVLSGVVLGVVGALATGRLLRSLVYGMLTDDGTNLLVTALVLLAVAAVAMTVPAIRAARVDPMVALRDE